MTKRDDKATELGRKAARLLKRSKPALKRLVEENRPKMEQAGRNTLKFAQEHEDEIRAAAIKGVKMRAGPLATAIDALAGQLVETTSDQAPAQASPACASCGAENAPSAKFCHQCGTRLPSS